MNLFEKVIFLDVDGVLNDCTGNIIVEEKRMERLKKIVDATGAQIVMTSTWRLFYPAFQRNQYQSESRSLMLLQKYLNQFQLYIADVTPVFTLGKNDDTRPMEIKAWLMGKVSTKSFVILDDYPFHWQWIQPFVVQTECYSETENAHVAKGLDILKQEANKRTLFGLEEIHVKKAIAILNQQD